MNPLISVILPVYNVEKLINTCLTSIINQTYKNIEIILVDDGSTDSSGKICDEYKEKDSRIKVVHKQNAGVSEARNTGIEISSGEYYCFIDSDDYVSSDYIEILYNQIIKYNADISCCSYAYKYPDGSEKVSVCTDKDENYVCCDKGVDTLEGILYGRSIYQPACWLKLFRRKSIGNIHFEKYKIGEDFLTCMDYYAKAEKVVFCNKPMYYYVQNDSSVMHSENLDKNYDMVITAEEIYKKAMTINPDLIKAASHYMIETNMIVLIKYMNLNGDKDRLSHIKENIKKHRKTVLFDKKARTKIRISCLISYFGFNTLLKIRNLTTK